MLRSVLIGSVKWWEIACDLNLLVKTRLCLLVLHTTLVGFLMGRRDVLFSYRTLFITLVGTALSAGGATALNQWLEQDWDACMERTRNRPLPGGRFCPSGALTGGILSSLTGIFILLLFVNRLCATLTIFTIASYLFLYTPLKRTTSLNTLVGAVSGALPPLIGCAAVRGQIGIEGYFLFTTLWLWQVPHFLAVAWMYRRQYARAGFVMLSKRDDSGIATSFQALVYTILLLIVSLLPVAAGLNTIFYLLPALSLGSWLVVQSSKFMQERSYANARALFISSIFYLPLLLGALLVTRR
ncbi:Protoheme IX farnesyltransferase [Candidatus Xiphinematobacter sp. Idaho Grape]|uniref:heme o synthase n=1 Tax=Candidatus Xiphinematobacter sp. Idaho Grape TaxID=1704307 RepID=UPI0007066357|nr:heme o synthase [Candidatus Xiphinematobacter sp. Idaho Grape]ALJ56236.1 Protoheme IX farnesyltransferase [Candidatus Xiphinematobacter sp. Idaho Grape]